MIRLKLQGVVLVGILNLAFISAAWAQNPGPFQLSSPANGATGVSVTPTLSWTASSNATSYKVEIALSSSFSPLIHQQGGITSMSYAVPSATLSSNTFYYWRVTAFRGSRKKVASNAPCIFTTLGPPGSFNQLGPVNGATISDPAFSWSASVGAESYVIQFANLDTFSWIVKEYSGITGTTFQAPYGDLPNQWLTLYWRVQAVNAAGTTSASNAPLSCRTQFPPGAFNLLTPAPGAVGQEPQPSFSWSASAYAGDGWTSPYYFELYRDAGFTNYVYATYTSATSISMNGWSLYLEQNQTYYWRVTARNLYGNRPAMNAPASFSVRQDQEPPTLSNLAHDQQSYSEMETVWFSVQASDAFGLSEVRFYVDGQLANTVVFSGGTFQYLRNGPHPIGLHSYFVEAVDINGHLARIPSAGTQTYTVTDQIVTKTLRGIRRGYSAGSLYAVGYFGTVARSTDSGASWTTTPPGAEQSADFSDIVFLNDSVGIAVGGVDRPDSNPGRLMHESIWRTSDGGDTWTQVHYYGAEYNTGSLTGVAFFDSSVGVAVGKNSRVLRTIDGGLSWVFWGRVKDPWTWLNALERIDANTAVAVGYNGIFRTGDQGLTWSEIPFPQRIFWDVSAPDASTVLAVGEKDFSGPVHRSLDGGLSWLEVSNTSTHAEGVSFCDATTGYVCGGQGMVKKSTDTGTSWISLPKATRNSLYGTVCLDANTVVAVGRDGILLRSTDGGQTWTKH